MKLSVLGIILALAGLAIAYIAYEPNQFQAIAVYPDGKRDTTHAFFKSEQDCNTWAKEQLSMRAISHNPNTVYVGDHSYKCLKFCPSKLECIINTITN